MIANTIGLKTPAARHCFALKPYAMRAEPVL